MSEHFSRIANKAALENLIIVSRDRPVVVFKHSNACPISSRAYREMSKLDNINLIEVQTAREVSLEVAQVTGIRHESPQVIILRNGIAVWNASHYDVDAVTVSEAIRVNS